MDVPTRVIPPMYDLIAHSSSGAIVCGCVLGKSILRILSSLFGLDDDAVVVGWLNIEGGMKRRRRIETLDS